MRWVNAELIGRDAVTVRVTSWRTKPLAGSDIIDPGSDGDALGEPAQLARAGTHRTRGVFARNSRKFR